MNRELDMNDVQSMIADLNEEFQSRLDMKIKELEANIRKDTTAEIRR